MNATFSAIDLENASSRLELTLFGCMNETVWLVGMVKRKEQSFDSPAVFMGWFNEIRLKMAYL